MKSCFDTDKAFHMSFDEVTFNADRIRSKLELLSEELMPRCGLVYELYQRRLSAAIDNFVATFAKWHLNRSWFGITIDHDLACFRSLIGILPVTPGINSFHHSLHCRV
ncbi:hypothetical protein ACQKB9_22540 [Escherichia coli]|uniref:hypothetical protein n=1 Tax=Escherichia coli TaxID=562 RepID=UPI003D060C90